LDAEHPDATVSSGGAGAADPRCEICSKAEMLPAEARRSNSDSSNVAIAVDIRANPVPMQRIASNSDVQIAGMDSVPVTVRTVSVRKATESTSETPVQEKSRPRRN